MPTTKEAYELGDVIEYLYDNNNKTGTVTGIFYDKTDYELDFKFLVNIKKIIGISKQNRRKLTHDNR